MISFAKAAKLVVEADASYDLMLAEGCWHSLAKARRSVESRNASLKDLSLCMVAECRNPSPIQDIPDFRYLIKVAAAGAEVNVKQYFVAVYQQINKNPFGFDLNDKIRYCASFSN